tara:strand:+ start:120 stop:722 length:603 start_codon:yes stop_codon:yes gene_type:complete
MKIIRIIFEILYVFIGVVLAFYAQHFIEKKSERRQTEFIVKTLISDIEKDINEITYNVEILENSTNKIDTAILNRKLGQNQVDAIIENVLFLHSETAYIQLSNKGFDIIKDNELRDKIIQTYEIQYNYITTKERYIWDLHLSTIFNSEFIYNAGNESFLTETQLGKLEMLQNKKSGLIKVYKETAQKIKKLLKMLRDYQN